jgi:hypothetical protein
MQQVFIEGNIYDVRKHFQVNCSVDLLNKKKIFVFFSFEEINDLLCE